MITVNVGALPFCVDSDALNAALGKQIQGAFEFPGISSGKAKIIKVGMKMMIRETLAMVERAIIAGKMDAEIEPPDWERADKDVLTYGMSYIFALALRDLEKQSFEAEYTEGPNGEIILTGLSTAPALPSSGLAGFLASADAPEATAAAGTVGAAGYADTPPADADTPAGGPQGDSSPGGGSMGVGGDEGDRQDHGGQEACEISVAVVSE